MAHSILTSDVDDFDEVHRTRGIFCLFANNIHVGLQTLLWESRCCSLHRHQMPFWLSFRL